MSFKGAGEIHVPRCPWCVGEGALFPEQHQWTDERVWVRCTVCNSLYRFSMRTGEVTREWQAPGIRGS